MITPTRTSTSRRTHRLDPYAKNTSHRMYLDKMADQMAKDLKAKLAALLGVAYANGTNVSDNFDKFPTQAKIAMISYCYGMVPNATPKRKDSAPKLLAGLQDLDFAAAAKECTLTNVTSNKNFAHQRLLANADRIIKTTPRPDPIPTTFKPPRALARGLNSAP